MAMYAYIAGTTNDDINDKGSIACLELGSNCKNC